MTRSDGAEEEIWGTREELLLACAVNRHGTQSWDSVAMEVRSRSPSAHLLTALTCKRRYHDLQRRFAAESDGIDGGEARGGPESAAISLFEALRELRVAELRREVARYDVSIGSLQLKVRRLKEDRERSLQEERSGDKSDPPEVEGGKKEAESPASTPVDLPVDRVVDGESGRSCHESNSTEPKGGQDPRTAEDGKLDDSSGGGADNGALQMDPPVGEDEKLAGEGSYNGSSDTVAKGAEAATPAEEPAATNPTRQPDAGESGESVAESKGDASKESSDVQSSASLSRRRRGRRKAAAAPSGGSSGGEEAEVDEVSPVSDREAAKPQPLASFLHTIRSHKHGSVFERRLESQESARYRSLIRQHMDLSTVHAKMEEGAYASDADFYRDLLLVCTNAVVFFPRDSLEHKAGAQLRQLVRKKVRTAFQRTCPPPPASAEEPAALPPTPLAPRQPVAPKAKAETDPSGLLRDKPISAPPVVACRKRSSIAVKATPKVQAAAATKAEDKPEPEKKEKEMEKEKEQEKDTETTEKKRTKERQTAVVATRGWRTSKGRGSNSGPAKNIGSSSASASADAALGASRAERKNAVNNVANQTTSAVAKKRSAVNFLSRMNRSATSSNGTLLETLKSSGGGGRGGGGEQKKGGRADGRKDQGGKQGSGPPGKQVREQSPPVKRSVGRPPKRPPPPLPPPPAKRAKEAEADVTPATRSAVAKKRGRR